MVLRYAAEEVHVLPLLFGGDVDAGQVSNFLTTRWEAVRDICLIAIPQRIGLQRRNDKIRNGGRTGGPIRRGQRAAGIGNAFVCILRRDEDFQIRTESNKP